MRLDLAGMAAWLMADSRDIAWPAGVDDALARVAAGLEKKGRAPLAATLGKKRLRRRARRRAGSLRRAEAGDGAARSDRRRGESAAVIEPRSSRVHDLARRAALLGVLRALVPAPARAGAGAGADSLTVEACAVLARARAPASVAAGLDAEAAVADSLAVSFNARPALSIDAGATVAPHGFYDPAYTNLGDYDARLGLAWTLADGGRMRLERRQAGNEAIASRWRAVMSSRDAGLRAASLALAIQRDQEVLGIRRDVLDWIERLESLVRSGVTAGFRSVTDSARVALERDNEVLALEGARADLRALRMQLAPLLGRPLDAETAIRADGADMRAPGAADSVRITAGIESLPEIALARLELERGRLDRQAAARRAAPTVDLVLDAGLAGTDLTEVVPPDLAASHPGATLADRLRRDLGASAGFRFHLPFLDPGLRQSIRARGAAVDAAAARLEAERTLQETRYRVLLGQWTAASERTPAGPPRDLPRGSEPAVSRESMQRATTPLLDLLDTRSERARRHGCVSADDVELFPWLARLADLR